MLAPGGTLVLTEQGETIAQKFGNASTAAYNLELLLAGVTSTTLLHSHSAGAADPLELLEEVGKVAGLPVMAEVLHPSDVDRDPGTPCGPVRGALDRVCTFGTPRARARREVDEGLLPAAQWALAVDGQGAVSVIDSNNHRVQRFRICRIRFVADRAKLHSGTPKRRAKKLNVPSGSTPNSFGVSMMLLATVASVPSPPPATTTSASPVAARSAAALRCSGRTTSTRAMMPREERYCVTWSAAACCRRWPERRPDPLRS